MKQKPYTFKRGHLLGIWVELLSASELTDLVDKFVKRGIATFVGNHNTHSLYYYHTDPSFRRLYDEHAVLVHVDGASICKAGKLLGLPIIAQHRVCYLDWLEPLLSRCLERKYRVFYLGGKPGVADRAATILRQRFPGLGIMTHHGYFNMTGSENDLVLKIVNQYQPNILMVGMGMPRQEKWIATNISLLNCGVILNAGATFDYLAGEVPTPPRWLGPIGLEWAYRALCEPRRLLPRYARVHTFFIGQLLLDLSSRTGLGRRRKIGVVTISVEDGRFGL